MPAYRTVIATAAVLLFATHVSAEPAVWRSDHVAVSYQGIEQVQAEAIGRVVEAARQAAIDQYGFDMPKTVTVTVTADPELKHVRLFTDGHDRITLQLRRPDDLRRPEVTGAYHVYGLCHEVGHLAMYRPITERRWLSSAAAEGWAHYLGSHLVDAVHAKLGDKGWCDPYDYRADGTQRLNKQLQNDGRPRPGSTVEGAALWQQLVTLIGKERVPGLFKAWQETKIDLADPGAALRATLVERHPDEKVAAWWNRAEPVLVVKRPSSEFDARTAKPAAMMKQPRQLSHDDGKPTGKRSMAGSGHVVAFDSPGVGWYLTKVRIHGARYGSPRPPADDFRVTLCDEQGKAIREFAFPYASFQRGAARWVDLPIEPTEVPAKFRVCVDFNPTGTKGVFVFFDTAGSGRSRFGLPGGRSRGFSNGDWLIRAEVDQLRSADALKPTP